MLNIMTEHKLIVNLPSFQLNNLFLTCNAPLEFKVHLCEDLYWHVLHDVLGKVAVAEDYKDFTIQLTDRLFSLYIHFVERPHNQQLAVSTTNVAIYSFLRKQFTLKNPI
jgi:hypothetical protein